MAALPQRHLLRVFWPSRLANDLDDISSYLLMGWVTCHNHPRGPTDGQISIFISNVKPKNAARCGSDSYIPHGHCQRPSCAAL